jgi:ribosomal 30S subunit maturation factor RimM
MSKLVELAAEFLKGDFSGKQPREVSEAIHPMKKKMEMEMMNPMKKKMEAMNPMKKKMEMKESYFLSQEEFQSLSEEEQEYYVNQLMELKNGMMKPKMGKKSKMM